MKKWGNPIRRSDIWANLAIAFVFAIALKLASGTFQGKQLWMPAVAILGFVISGQIMQRKKLRQRVR